MTEDSGITSSEHEPHTPESLRIHISNLHLPNLHCRLYVWVSRLGHEPEAQSDRQAARPIRYLSKKDATCKSSCTKYPIDRRKATLLIIASYHRPSRHSSVNDRQNPHPTVNTKTFKIWGTIFFIFPFPSQSKHEVRSGFCFALAAKLKRKKTI